MIEFGDDILAEYVLGSLPAEQAATIEQAASRSPDLRRAIDEIGALLCAVGEALEPATPPPALRERLLASAAATNRFERFVQRVGELIDVSLTKAKALLNAIDDPSSWVPGFAHGIDLYHLDGGPRVANAVVGFVRMKAGIEFPHHYHVGDETVLVLQGQSIDEDGSVAGPGDVVFRPADTEHAFTTNPDAPDYIYLVIVETGVRIGGQLIGPDDPSF